MRLLFFFSVLYYLHQSMISYYNILPVVFSVFIIPNAARFVKRVGHLACSIFATFAESSAEDCNFFRNKNGILQFSISL